MEVRGRCLLVLFFLLPILSPASFSGCFEGGAVERFWLSPLYWSQNPNLYHLGPVDIYKPELDRSLSSLELESLWLESPQALLESVPSQDRQSLEGASTLLSKAGNALLSAKQSREEARRVLGGTQKIADLTDFTIRASGVGIIYNLYLYVTSYPKLFSATLSSTADSLDYARMAGFEVGELADRKMAELEAAGAGKPSYSGKAKQPYFYARSLLSSQEELCAPQKARGISSYFASKPAFPDFSQAGFPGYVSAAYGSGGNSTLLRLARLYGELSQAKRNMEKEYVDSRASASQAVSELSQEVSWLSKQKLELIGEPPIGTAANRSIAGSGFSGILSGYLLAKERLDFCQMRLSQAEMLVDAKPSGYLADAISYAKEAEGTARASFYSAKLVRSSAEAAVEAQRVLAQKALADAEKTASALQPDAFGLADVEHARRLIAQARQKIDSADARATLGEKFSDYKEALALVSGAKAAIGRSAWQPDVEEAKRAITELKSVLEKAGSDGLDVEYELSLAADYEKILSSASSPFTAQQILQAAKAEKERALFRLYEKYRPAEDDYGKVAQLVSAIREQEPLFLQKFDALSQFFSSGKLDAIKAVGQLKRIRQDLSDFYAEAQKKLPLYLSALLSKNSVTQELAETPILGKPTRYFASITTRNPSEFGYSGKLKFNARTALPLYSPDFSYGDAFADAYPEGQKTAIVLDGVEPFSSFHLAFERTEQPAQIVQSSEECHLALPEGAEIARIVQFTSSRPLGALLVQEEVPPSARQARLSFAGRAFDAQISGGKVEGAVGPVQQGRNSLLLQMLVGEPFSIVRKEANYEALPSGARKALLRVEVVPSIDCDAAVVRIYEPAGEISRLSVSPLSSSRVSAQYSVSGGSGTFIIFSIQPIKKGMAEQFIISYEEKDAEAGLAAGFEQAEAQVRLYGRAKDSARLMQARQLAAANRTQEALSILAQIGQEGFALAYRYADYQSYLSENESAAGLLSELEKTVQELLPSIPQQAALLSKISQGLSPSLSEAAAKAEEGEYQKAASMLAKARADASEALAELCWKNSKEASESYAQARKMPMVDEGLLSEAEGLISLSQRRYAEGKALQSFVLSSQAIGLLAQASKISQDAQRSAASQTAQIAEKFALLRKTADEMLFTYSSTYSALEGASKKQLPLTPAAIQKSLSELDRSMQQASSGKLGAQGSLELANKTLAGLQGLADSIESSLAYVKQSAASQLSVAKASLSESRQKASEEEKGELSQIEQEVSAADALFSEGLYAQSLMASKRAIGAASAFLSKKSGAGTDAKTLLLWGVSLIFVLAASYYFLFAGSKKPPEKKALPKKEG
ncbi:MAG: hypothetical protein N3E51_00315 [Candidatus Micrarchaeota archaeon]|nr:hypothetical protein [Candidatus Micrarchaeota archaeon]